MASTAAGVAVGLGLFLFGGWQVRKVFASRKWKRTTGVVAGVDVRETPGGADAPGTATYSPAVQYRFEAAGKPYDGSRIRFVEKGFDTREKATAELRRFQVGAQVQVFYNPLKPSDCVLERKSGFIFYVLMMLGVMVVVGSIAGWCK
jgi:hypothetical protein